MNSKEQNLPLRPFKDYMKSNIINILLLFSLGVTLFGLGFKAGEWRTMASNLSSGGFSNSAPESARKLDFELFWETWNNLEQKYVDKKKLDTQKMFYGAIKGM